VDSQTNKQADAENVTLSWDQSVMH